jgi:hypothetical protein
MSGRPSGSGIGSSTRPVSHAAMKGKRRRRDDRTPCRAFAVADPQRSHCPESRWRRSRHCGDSPDCRNRRTHGFARGCACSRAAPACRGAKGSGSSRASPIKARLRRTDNPVVLRYRSRGYALSPMLPKPRCRWTFRNGQPPAQIVGALAQREFITPEAFVLLRASRSRSRASFSERSCD